MTFFRRTGRATSIAAGLASLTLLATACGGGSDLAGGGDEGGSDADNKSINIALIPWEEAIASTNMWKVVLEDLGYDVTITDVDVAPMYQGVANGDIDLFLDTWLPQTHSDYWDEYGDQLEDLGYWYDNATLTVTVPSYVEDVNSIADLADDADLFDSRIVGIEAGSGLMRTVREEAIPTYGLEDYDLLESSTAAMLAELDSAIADEKPIVVTLWRPHIAYAQYDLKDLEDPEGAMGEAEKIHMVGRDGFGADYPELAGWLSDFQLNDDELGDLEQAVLVDHESDPEAGAREWLAANPEFIERTLGDAGAELDY
ncbi:glycine betaine ABC transporter substrate-binding protein [Nocardiopsis ansamitocini]|uniref:ABC transporter substrate-binding protein n=1 Tax=Nocardiopsis ansamitocini TaxID=1670832 RepID=A0A9W6PAT6_9ACTN|nr:glycine betaine ABC transporter substrate-binding protein [Nocardiopsis ansamitocini]GLU50122.1 ABC transporter substrate-binding protein [Nocardiopsis ansamitocini]